MRAGDLGFAHTTGIIGRAIRFGEWIRGRSHASTWNHAFILDRPAENGDWYIIQAEAKGVTNDKLLSQVAPGGTYQIVPLPAILPGNYLLRFARAQVGAKYGIVTIFSCVVDILLPDSICLRRSNTWICSGLVAASLMYAGCDTTINMAKKDIYTMMPSEVFTALTA
jgi:hypothetical protein